MRPVVLFTGWWIDGSSSGLDVWVLKEKCLPGFPAREDTVLGDREIDLIPARPGRSSREAWRSRDRVLCGPLFKVVTAADVCYKSGRRRLVTDGTMEGSGHVR